MAEKLGDLTQYFSPGLTLTVLGKEYALPLPSAELGLWCQLVAQAAGRIHSAETDDEMQSAIEQVHALPELPGGLDVTLAERVLGDVHGQLVGDRVPWPYIEFCGATAYIWVLRGEEMAERYWTSGGRPEAWSPANRTERRAQARAGRTSTAEAAATRTRASTSGTKSPKKSAASAPAKASRGKRSSGTGG